MLGAGTQATVDAGGLTVDGAYVNVTGDGTFGVAGPLTVTDGGWVESDVDATWSGTAPWHSAAVPGRRPTRRRSRSSRWWAGNSRLRARPWRRQLRVAATA